MLTEQIKKSKTNTSQKILYELNDYIIKIDYFDKKGIKNLEDNIPLTCIFDPVTDLRK